MVTQIDLKEVLVKDAISDGTIGDAHLQKRRYPWICAANLIADGRQQVATCLLASEAERNHSQATP
jgi:hypothetical protein